jgi:hypothetical protein
MTRLFWAGLRAAYALLFVPTGIVMALCVAGYMTNPFKQPNAAAQAWSDGLEQAPFFTPMLAAVYLVAGLLMLPLRTVPLALALLSGPVAVIVAYHLTLSGLYGVGAGLAAVHALLLWRYRAGFVPLWRFREPRRR